MYEWLGEEKTQSKQKGVKLMLIIPKHQPGDSPVNSVLAAGEIQPPAETTGTNFNVRKQRQVVLKYRVTV